MMITRLEPFKPSHYTAYLVRLWQESPHRPWRASTQSVHTGEKVYFANLDDLFAFLHAQTEDGSTGKTWPPVQFDK
jgi:hypothetical protein